MNRSLSVAVLAALPESLRAATTPERPAVRWLRRAADRHARRVDARRLVRGEHDAARIASAREGVVVGRSPSPGRPPMPSALTDYDVLRRIR